MYVFLVVCCQLSAANAKLFSVRGGERCGFSDGSGKDVIPLQFRNCGDFSEGLAPVQVDDLWGYIDENGAFVIKPRFLAADRFSEGLAFVTASAESNAVIDRKGKTLFQADYYEHAKFSQGLAAVHPVNHWYCSPENLQLQERCPDGKGTPVDSRWGYIDTSGRMAIPARFLGAGEFHDGLAYADGGFIDPRGDQVIAGPFSSATSFADGVAAVQVDYQKWGYIDQRGNWLAWPDYDEAGAMVEQRGLVKRNGKYGFADASGALVIPLQFDDALPFSGQRAAVRKGAKWGYIDTSGGVVISFGFDSAQSFQDGFATVVLESRVALIDKRGVPVQTQPLTLAQTFQRLQGFGAGKSGLGPFDQILPTLSVYKDQLRELAVEVMKDTDDPASIKAAIEGRLRAAGVRHPKEEESRPYGLIDGVEVVVPPLQPKLLSVGFHLYLPYGISTSLSLFHRHGSGWDLVFKSDRNDDAYHIATPQFSLDDSKGSFLMLLASDSGRSGNGSYQLWVDLYRVHASFDKEQVFHQVYYGRDHQIALDATSFRLETISMEHDVRRAGYRVFPYRYEIHGDDVVRVSPIGFDVHDFVGEWGNLPWDEAKRWANPRIDSIRDYHNKLRDANGLFIGDFGSVQICDPQQNFWQVAFSQAGEDDPTYFLVERKDRWTFQVENIGPTKRAGCQPVEWSPNQPFSTMFSQPLKW